MNHPITTRNMVRSVGFVSILSTAMTSCIDSRLPPEPPIQKAVKHDGKLYLRDLNAPLTEKGHCSLLGVVSNGKIGTVDLGAGQATNCFVNVKTKALDMDVVEVTNELFQLCVDSSICKKPIPLDYDKTTVCASENDFDRCPVAGVPHDEAKRFCEFLGRRVPTIAEHIIARYQTKGPSPEDVVELAPEKAAGCENARLLDCGKPGPIAGSRDVGSAPNDKSDDGIYDLVGNVSEWASDLLPGQALKDETAGAIDLPWFCVRTRTATTTVDCDKPGATCAYATFRVGTSTATEVRPFCAVAPDLAVPNGSTGVLMGGSIAATRQSKTAGVYVQTRLEGYNKRNGIDTDALKTEHGFRCASSSVAVQVLKP